MENRAKIAFDPATRIGGGGYDRNETADPITALLGGLVFLVLVLGLCTVIGFDNEPHLDPETVWDAPFERP